MSTAQLSKMFCKLSKAVKKVAFRKFKVLDYSLQKFWEICKLEKFAKAVALRHFFERVRVKQSKLMMKILFLSQRSMAFQDVKKLLKILAHKDKNLAFQQLDKFIKEKRPQCGEAYQLLGKWQLEKRNYKDAIHNFLAAFNYPMEPLSRELNYLFCAETWYYLNNYKSCAETGNNYLRKYPAGKFCDSIIYYLAESALMTGDTEKEKAIILN